MSHFYFSYQGNKRQEMKYINIDFDNYDIIIEPYAGSCSFSHYLYFNKGLKNKEYIINDIDSNLIKLFNDIKQSGSKKYYDYCNDFLLKYKEETKEAIEDFKNKIKNKENSLLDYFFYNKIYNFHKGKFPTRGFGKKLKENTQTDEFYKKAHIYNVDAFEIIEKYKDNHKALIFLDPPYFNSCNNNYIMNNDILKDENNNIIYEDGTKLYIDLLDLYKGSKCKLFMIINGNSILNYLYRDYITNKYIKKYANQINKKNNKIYQRQTYHIIVENHAKHSKHSNF